VQHKEIVQETGNGKRSLFPQRERALSNNVERGLRTQCDKRNGYLHYSQGSSRECVPRDVGARTRARARARESVVSIFLLFLALLGLFWVAWWLEWLDGLTLDHPPLTVRNVTFWFGLGFGVRYVMA